jgi:hypothetical protein
VSRQTPSALLAKLADQSTTLATCWKIELTDATVLGFTDHDQDIVYSGVTYQAATGFTRTAYEQQTGLIVDNMDIQGFFDSAAITEADVLAGLYQDAKIWAFVLDYTDTALGIHKLDYGYLGNVTIRDQLFTCEFRSIAQRLQQPIGEKYGALCRVQFGSSECGVAVTSTAWAADTQYEAGDFVAAVTPDGRRYECATPGVSNPTEPTWNTTVGNTTSEIPAAWQASTAYVLDDVVSATTYDDRRYKCTTAGTSHSSEPTWNTVLGATTTETGGVEWETILEGPTWTTHDSLTKTGTVTSVVSKKSFEDSSRTEADNYFQYGVLTWLTGNNTGFQGDVKRSTLSGGQMYLRFDCPYTIQVGDTYTLTAGCNHLLKAPGDTVGTTYTGDCVARYDNAKNFRGEPEIPGSDEVFAGYQG